MTLATTIGKRQACAVIGVARATMQRGIKPRLHVLAKCKAKSDRPLANDERAANSSPICAT